MKEWYLLDSSTRPNALGGYENEAFVDWKGDAFLETLTTDIASDVVIYNHDMSLAKSVRAIVQDNVSDTALRSMQRTILVPIGTLKGGDYIGFDENIWIVDGRPGNNHIYEKATLKLCQYKLKWQKTDGTIVERWANLESASKYDVGERVEKAMLLPTNNFTILIPFDNDGFTIEDKRVFIDPNDPKTKVFKITRGDDVLFKYDAKGGVISLIADRHELNVDTDRPDLELCDYIDIQDPTPTPDTRRIIATISGRTSLKVGYTNRYTVSFKDQNGNPVSPSDVYFQWALSGDIASSITMTVAQDKLSATLYTNDDSLIENSFELQMLVSTKVNTYLPITVADLY